jgi:hypothetical protein
MERWLDSKRLSRIIADAAIPTMRIRHVLIRTIPKTRKHKTIIMLFVFLDFFSERSTRGPVFSRIDHLRNVRACVLKSIEPPLNTQNNRWAETRTRVLGNRSLRQTVKQLQPWLQPWVALASLFLLLTPTPVFKNLTLSQTLVSNASCSVYTLSLTRRQRFSLYFQKAK